MGAGEPVRGLCVFVYPYGGVVGMGVPIRGVVGMGLGCCVCWCAHKGLMCLCVPIRGVVGMGFGVLWVLVCPYGGAAGMGVPIGVLWVRVRGAVGVLCGCPPPTPYSRGRRGP